MRKIGLWYIFFCLSFMNHNVFADEALGIDKQSEASQSIPVNNEDLANNNNQKITYIPLEQKIFELSKLRPEGVTIAEDEYPVEEYELIITLNLKPEYIGKKLITKENLKDILAGTIEEYDDDILVFKDFFNEYYLSYVFREAVTDLKDIKEIRVFNRVIHQERQKEKNYTHKFNLAINQEWQDILTLDYSIEYKKYKSYLDFILSLYN